MLFHPEETYTMVHFNMEHGFLFLKSSFKRSLFASFINLYNLENYSVLINYSDQNKCSIS